MRLTREDWQYVAYGALLGGFILTFAKYFGAAFLIFWLLLGGGQ